MGLRVRVRVGLHCSQGARKRKAITDINAEKAKVKREHDNLREALDSLEEQLRTGYDSEDGTHPSRLKTTAVTRVLRSVSSKKKGPRPQEHHIVDLDAEESDASPVTSTVCQV